MAEGHPASGIHAEAGETANGIWGEFDIGQSLHQERLTGKKDFSCDRAFDRDTRIAWKYAGIVGTHELHRQITGRMIEERQSRCVMRDHFVDASRNGGEQLLDVQIGQQRVAELEHDRFFSALAIGKVARHLGISGYAAGVVADCGQDGVGPEARTVLAHTPAFFLDSSARGG